LFFNPGPPSGPKSKATPPYRDLPRSGGREPRPGRGQRREATNALGSRRLAHPGTRYRHERHVGSHGQRFHRLGLMPDHVRETSRNFPFPSAKTGTVAGYQMTRSGPSVGRALERRWQGVGRRVRRGRTPQRSRSACARVILAARGAAERTSIVSRSMSTPIRKEEASAGHPGACGSPPREPLWLYRGKGGCAPPTAAAPPHPLFF
jgi:hypothetical protein